jgi:putative transposase
MPRLNRNIQIEDQCSLHKIWRGHNRENKLWEHNEKRQYLRYLGEKLNGDGIQFHAFCLMDNHAHEIYQIDSVRVFSNFMRAHHMLYGQYFNSRHGRSGRIADGRPKTIQFLTDMHEMRCCLYIHANPLKANMVEKAEDYIFSTHRYYAYGVEDFFTKWITFPRWYLQLGRTPSERQKEYLELFEAYLMFPGS